MRLLISLWLVCLLAGCMSQESDRLTPPTPSTRIAAAETASVPPAPRLEADRIVARDGAVLPLRCWLPKAKPRAVILALHGFNDYSNAFAYPGARLARQGIATFAYDQRGFGIAPMPGRWAGTDAMVNDAVTALVVLRQRYPGVPLYLMGESMGAAIAILAANRGAQADGFIILAPAVWGRSAMNLFERTGLWLADLMPAIEWSPRFLPVTIRPSDNVAMLRELGADPLVIKTSRSDTLNGLVDLMGTALAAAPQFTARALILYGLRDEIVPRAPVAQFVASLPPEAAERQRVALYPAGFHLLLRDLEGPQVTADVLAWIDDTTAPLPSGADRDARALLTGQPTRPTSAAKTAPGLAPQPRGSS